MKTLPVSMARCLHRECVWSDRCARYTDRERGLIKSPRLCMHARLELYLPNEEPAKKETP